MVLKERSGQEIDMIESAVRICRGYLSGPWKKITSQDVSVKRLSGGLSNILYHVKLEFTEAKPHQVLLRLYGQTHGEGALENLITESVIFTLLSERKIGPKLYGVFPGGRIEEFIPASPCTITELAQEENSLIIAEKMAEIHTMNVPINKEPRWVWDTMNRWLSTLYSTPFSGKEKSLLSFNLKEEVSWLKSYLSKIPSPVVFCHNDLQEGNILKQSKRFVIIDFEYCAYNYRGFELANHFIEWTYDYTKKEYPHFSVHKDNYCQPELMSKFIERYLSTLYPNGVPKPEVNNVKTIMNEIKNFTLASHLLWCIWAILNSRISQIPFGFLEYAEERFNSYKKLKSELICSKEKAAVKRKVEE